MAEKAICTDTDSESTRPRDGGSTEAAEPVNVQEDTIDPENEITGIKLYLIHLSICICTFIIGLDFNLIATATSVITSHFNSIGDVGWYGAAFYMTLCASQPLAGKTYVLLPKKIVYLSYLAIFEIGSLVCALAPTSNALIAGRAIAGFGASGVFAGGFVILTTVIPLHKRAIWTATMSSCFAIASVVGPPIGGALTQHVSWRWCFYINLPIGGLSALIILLFFRVKRAAIEHLSVHEKLKSLDFVGFTLFAASIVMLLLALQWGGITYAWQSSIVIGLFVGFGVTFIVFVVWQVHMVDDALIPPKLFAHRNAGLIITSSFFVNGPFQTIVFWLPIWFQAILAATPESSGVRYLPTVIADALASVVGAGMVMQLGVWNPFLLFAEAMVCLGAGLLTTLNPNISSGHWIGYQIFGGIGYSLATNIAHLGLQASLSKELVPIGATTLLTVMSTSCAIFLAIGQAIFQHRLGTNLAHIVSRDQVDEIISTGALNFRTLISPPDLSKVLDAYSKSLTQIWYLPAAAPVVSFLLVACTRWTLVKKEEHQVPANKTVDEGG